MAALLSMSGRELPRVHESINEEADVELASGLKPPTVLPPIRGSMKINHPESINVSVASAIHKQKSQNNLNETSNGDKQKVQSQNVNDPNGNVIKSEVIEKKNSKGNHLNQSTESVDSFALKLQKMTKIQRQAHFFFVRPSSRMAKAFEFCSIAFVVLSTLIFIIETLPLYLDKQGNSILEVQLLPVEIFVTLFWVVEIIGRFVACTRKLHYFMKPLTWIDIISVLPLALDSSGNADIAYFAHSLTIIRLLKLLHVIHYSTGMIVAGRAIKKSVSVVMLLFTFLSVALLLTATAMHWIERGWWDPSLHAWMRIDNSGKTVISPFNSIPEGFYWSMTTLTSVGYGDVVPVTWAGKLVACITMCVSIFVIALPTSVLGSNFMSEWELHHQTELQKQMQKAETNTANKEKNISAGTLLLSGTAVNIEKEKIGFLEERNRKYLKAVEAIQERLNDINPPRYYNDYKELKGEYEQCKIKIIELERKLLSLDGEIPPAESTTRLPGAFRRRQSLMGGIALGLSGSVTASGEIPSGTGSRRRSIVNLPTTGFGDGSKPDISKLPGGRRRSVIGGPMPDIVGAAAARRQSILNQPTSFSGLPGVSAPGEPSGDTKIGKTSRRSSFGLIFGNKN